MCLSTHPITCNTIVCFFFLCVGLLYNDLYVCVYYFACTDQVIVVLIACDDPYPRRFHVAFDTVHYDSLPLSTGRVNTLLAWGYPSTCSGTERMRIGRVETQLGRRDGDSKLVMTDNDDDTRTSVILSTDAISSSLLFATLLPKVCAFALQGQFIFSDGMFCELEISFRLPCIFIIGIAFPFHQILISCSPLSVIDNAFDFPGLFAIA